MKRITIHESEWTKLSAFFEYHRALHPDDSVSCEVRESGASGIGQSQRATCLCCEAELDITDYGVW